MQQLLGEWPLTITEAHETSPLPHASTDAHAAVQCDATRLNQASPLPWVVDTSCGTCSVCRSRRLSSSSPRARDCQLPLEGTLGSSSFSARGSPARFERQPPAGGRWPRAAGRPTRARQRRPRENASPDAGQQKGPRDRSPGPIQFGLY
jgi:hypothetical protein